METMGGGANRSSVRSQLVSKGLTLYWLALVLWPLVAMGQEFVFTPGPPWVRDTAPAQTATPTSTPTHTPTATHTATPAKTARPTATSTPIPGCGGLVQEAREVLDRHRAQAVLGPCPDGGYYLVGLKNTQPQLFQGINWSSSTVLADTLTQAERLGLTVHLLPSWPDIDTPADLQAFISSPQKPSAPGWRSYNLARHLLGV